MNIKSAETELENAMNKRCLRAAFGSIVRRNYDEIKSISTDEKKQLIKNLGMADSYYTEL